METWMIGSPVEDINKVNAPGLAGGDRRLPGDFYWDCLPSVVEYVAFYILAGETNQYLFWLAGFGPTISATLLTACTQGFSGVKRLFYLGWRVRTILVLHQFIGNPAGHVGFAGFARNDGCRHTAVY